MRNQNTNLKRKTKIPDDMLPGTIYETLLDGQIKIIEYKKSAEIVVVFLLCGTVVTTQSGHIRGGNVRSYADVQAGTVHTSKNFGDFEVVTYKHSNAVVIKFIGYQELLTATATNIRMGLIKNYFMPYVWGKGYQGIGDYLPINHKKAYETWNGMLRRCYSDKLSAKQPTYIGCSVDECWHNFQVFCKWFYEVSNYVDGMNLHLDKDLKVRGNKIYGPDTCLFVTPRVNVFLACLAASNKYGVGVSFDKRIEKLRVQSYNLKGKNINLGVYIMEDIKKAQDVYKDFKYGVRDELVLLQTDEKVAYYLSRWVIPGY